MTAIDSFFFERLSHCALRDLSGVIADNHAPIVAATSLLIREQAESLHDAFTHVSALDMIHEGGVFLKDHDCLCERLPHLARLENEIISRSRVSKALLRLLTLQWLNQQATLPKFLNGIEEVICERAVDLTECEIQLVFRLAELSQAVKFRMPIDRKSRGLLQPVQSVLSQIEARSSLLPISVELEDIQTSKALEPFFNAIFDDKYVSESRDFAAQAVITSQFSTQVNWVCERIVEVRRSLAPVSIAIAFRSLDQRVSWFEEELHRRRVPCKIHANLPVNELSESKILLRRFRERLGDSSKYPISLLLQEAIEIVDDDDVKRYFQYFSHALEGEVEGISLQSFYHWMEVLLQRRDVAFRSDFNADVVEFVSVKHMHERKFDYVFLVDLAQGRFPKTDAVGTLFSDSEAHAINKLLNRRVLPVFFEDPLELSIIKTKIGFESLWFVDTITSAQKGLFLSSSSQDPGGREQASSLFLNAATRIIGLQNPTSETRHAAASIKLARKRQKVSFQMDPIVSTRIFARWLGLNSSHPLTPSRLEAFANCSFRSLIEKIFGIEDSNRSTHDIDARKIGQFAHSVLEKFFREKKSFEDSGASLSLSERERLFGLIQENKLLLQDETQKTPAAIINAQIFWLKSVLERAVSNLLKAPAIPDVYPFLFEERLGFGEISFKVKINEQDIFLGGILDRVDKGLNTYAVVDYKMSSSMALRQQANPREIHKTQFQLSLYLRLLMETYPQAKEGDVYAYLVSIQDGVTSNVLGKDTVTDLKSLVLDDEREDGLTCSIKKVMHPILKGQFLAKRNPTCDYCHLKSVCRIRSDEGAQGEHE